MGDNTEMGTLAGTEELHAKQQEAARKEAERAARKAPQDAAADAKGEGILSRLSRPSKEWRAHDFGCYGLRLVASDVAIEADQRRHLDQRAVVVCATSMLSTVISGSFGGVMTKFCCLAPSIFRPHADIP
jgi:hypothetical protein